MTFHKFVAIHRSFKEDRVLRFSSRFVRRMKHAVLNASSRKEFIQPVFVKIIYTWDSNNFQATTLTRIQWYVILTNENAHRCIVNDAVCETIVPRCITVLYAWEWSTCNWNCSFVMDHPFNNFSLCMVINHADTIY